MNANRQAQALSVTHLVRKMKNLLENEIGTVWVDGEISNFKKYASGHAYFTLKDEGAQISCVFFRGRASRSLVQPENGMQVRLLCDVSLYESRGQLQLIVQQVEDIGLGNLQVRFEALKRALDAEGLFRPEHKQKIPSFPQTIGLVTSPNGAALQDILNVLSRRAPWVQPILYPVQVQGKGAEEAIAHAIYQWGHAEKFGLPKVDVLIVGRGGGSLEDLWNFNEEVVARAIYDCSIPVISAVGHEIDFTIADFVADLRAPTPSAAAELAVPDAEELRARVAGSYSAMRRVLEGRLRHDTAILASARRLMMPRDADGIERALRDPLLDLDRVREDLKLAVERSVERLDKKLEQLKVQHAAHHPERIMLRRFERLAHMKTMFEMAGKSAIQRSEQRLNHLSGLVRALGPEATFARGFSLTMDRDGRIVKDATQLQAGDEITSQFAKGKVTSRVQ